MKTSITSLIPLILSILLLSCEKDNNSGDEFPDVPFDIAFYVVDPAGNLVFPVNGEYSSIYEPSDFYAYSMFSDSIGMYNSHTDQGHIFRIRESSQRIIDNTNLWNEDSILTFYFCFADLCDSVKLYKPNISKNSAEWLLLQGDTTHNFRRNLLTYELNE